MRIRGIVLAAYLAVALAGCGSSAGSLGGSGAGNAASGEITVLAAASLTEAFTTIGKDFSAANPGTTVRFSFGASSALAEQVNAGAPADVFATASASTMDTVVQAGNATGPQAFARNAMAIAVPPGNPGQVTGVESLADPDVKVALCQPEVPCGSVAAQVLDNAGVTVTPVTLEPDVKAVLSKVSLQEVDAGVVYVTDVQAAGATVEGVDIPDDLNASTTYPIATLTHAPDAALAAAFVAYVLSPAGQSVLRAYGFSSP